MRLILVLALALGAGCTRADYIELEPTTVELQRRGQTTQVKARALDRRGHYYPDILFDWTTENPEIAEVDERGFVKAVSSGRTFVHAATGDLDSKVLVRVNLVERILVKDEELVLSLEAGERTEPRIEIFDYQDQPMRGRQIFLKARDESIVTIDGQGGIWPQQKGETVVDADVEGVKGEIRVKVVK